MPEFGENGGHRMSKKHQKAKVQSCTLRVRTHIVLCGCFILGVRGGFGGDFVLSILQKSLGSRLRRSWLDFLDLERMLTSVGVHLCTFLFETKVVSFCSK